MSLAGSASCSTRTSLLKLTPYSDNSGSVTGTPTQGRLLSLGSCMNPQTPTHGPQRTGTPTPILRLGGGVIMGVTPGLALTPDSVLSPGLAQNQDSRLMPGNTLTLDISLMQDSTLALGIRLGPSSSSSSMYHISLSLSHIASSSSRVNCQRHATAVMSMLNPPATSTSSAAMLRLLMHLVRATLPATAVLQRLLLQLMLPCTQAKLSHVKDSAGPESDDCVVCWAHDKDVGCIPCGHVAMCKSCSKAVMAQSGLCPVCRQNIREIVQLYRT